jgi:hypothetical protein
MGSVEPINVRLAEIAEIAKSGTNVVAIRKHVKEVIEGAEFKGSPRCGRFLQYVVDRALIGDFEALKERAIGTVLFGRSQSYNNADDAIVRVTASDVRKRLRQHYGQNGARSEFRLDLPAGAYVPEFKRGRRRPTTRIESANLPHPGDLSSELNDPSAALPDVELVSCPLPTTQPIAPKPTARPRWQLAVILLSSVILVFSTVVLVRLLPTKAKTTDVLPWSTFFHSEHRTLLIVSDPDIAKIQRITGNHLSVADYAHHNYLPEPNKLTLDERRIIDENMQGYSTAAVDAGFSSVVGALARTNSENIPVRGARFIDLSVVETDDNFIFLGSPVSNPWSSMFNNQLDFQFVVDPKFSLERIRNLHPRPHEEIWYTGTSLGQAVEEEFAIVAFVQNLSQKGQVLLLAGEGEQGTRAAGAFVTDLPRLSTELQKCGINPRGPVRHFEFLLRLTTIAGSMDHSEVVACHILN